MNPFCDIIKIYAKRCPRRNALISGTTGRVVSWNELNNQINCFANALYDMGVRKGDRGIIMLQNCIEFFVSFFGLQKVGALPCPMNYRFTPAEIEYQANHSDSKVFITNNLFIENVKTAMPDMPSIEHYIVVGEGNGFWNYEDLLRHYPPEELAVDCELDDESQLAYTGGTTGYPKGVITTYKQTFAEFEGFLGVLFKYLTETRLPSLRLPIPFGPLVGRIIGSDITARMLQHPIKIL